jgi:hypothetical protein
MAARQVFDTVEALVEFCYVYYRDHTTTCSGPRAVVAKLWSMVRLSPELRTLLAQEGLAYRLSSMATHPTRQALQAPTGTVTLYTHTAEGEPQEGTVDVLSPHVEPQIVYPVILTGTVYTVGAQQSKPLIKFTRADFTYVMQGFAQQIQGLTDHQTAFAHGKALLDTHHVARVEQLPADALQAYATEWEQVKKGKPIEAAAD